MMNWEVNESGDSDNEMFQMSSSLMQEDNSRERLLSLSEEDDIPETSQPTGNPPELQFRRSNGATSKAADEKKSRTAVISILIIGLALIIMINIGLGIKLKGTENHSNLVNTIETCPTEKAREFAKCNKSFPWQHYRLPDTLYPKHYSIFLHPNLTNGNYSGHVEITISVIKATDKIIFHSRMLSINDIKIVEKFLKRSVEVAAESVVYQDDNHILCEELDFVAIPLKEKLTSGKQYVIHIEFSGDMAQSLRGFYLSKYRTKSGENRTIATTQFESTDARAAFPCFDEPAFKANFTLSMVREKGYKTLSNMPVKKTSDFSAGLELDEFETSVPMSTYLVAFIVSDFKAISKTVELKNGPMMVSVYAAPDKIDTAEFALNVSCDVIEFYEKLFKVPYPLQKLDLIAIPDFEAGAMENWGLVTYRETLVLWDKNSSSIYDQEKVALVIAHELAHQWFGNLVTMKWWNDLWLNEGFASYMEFYAIGKIFPEWHYMEQFYFYHTYAAMRMDESEFTHPISVPVNSKLQIEEVFDSISYSKGACLIAMMIDYVGEEAFLNGVGDYLNKYAYSNAENKDLLRAVAARANLNQRQSAQHMLDSWTNKPGFPVLSVSLTGNEITVSQNRYLLSVDDEKEDSKCVRFHVKNFQQNVPIPVSYISNLSKTRKWEYFENRTTRFSVLESPKWMIFNVKRGGYYVVNYSKTLLAGLATQLKKDHTVISPTDRAGILFNAEKSAQAGLSSYDALLDLLLYLKNEKDYGPLSTAADVLLRIGGFFERQFDYEAYCKIKDFSAKLFMHLYKEYGWPKAIDSDASLSHPQIKLKKLAVKVLCTIDNKDCTSKALEWFNSWKVNSTEVPPDYKNIVYSTGIRLGPPENWDYMWNKFASDITIDAHEKHKLLQALCYTTEETKIMHLLHESLKGEHITFQNTDSVFSYLRSTRVGSYVAWKFLRANWRELTKLYPMGSFSNRELLTIFNSFTDESDIASGKEFLAFSNMTELRYAKRALDHAKLNVHWIKTYQPQIVEWLNNNLEKA